MNSTSLLPFQPDALTPAQLAAVSFLARFSGHTHSLYTYQLRCWLAWCDTNGLTVSDPAVYARLPKIHADESRTQGLDRLALIRFLKVAQTISVHDGALAYLLGINALRASEAAAVRIEDYAETLLRGHRVLHLVGKGNKRNHAPHRPRPRPRSMPRATDLGATRAASYVRRSRSSCGTTVCQAVSREATPVRRTASVHVRLAPWRSKRFGRRTESSSRVSCLVAPAPPRWSCFTPSTGW